MSDDSKKPELDRDKWSFWLIAVTAALTLVTFLLMVKLSFDLADGPPGTNSRAVSQAIERASNNNQAAAQPAATDNRAEPADEASETDTASAGVDGPSGAQRPAVLDQFISDDFVVPAPLPEVTTDNDEYYGLPMLVRRVNNDFLRPYFAFREGLRVVYTQPTLSNFQPDLMYVPREINGRLFLPWQTSVEGSPGLHGIFPGNELILLDNYIYDFGVGVYFVRIHNLFTDTEGFMTLETLLAETEVVGNQMWEAVDIDLLRRSIMVELEGTRLYAIQLPNDLNVIEQQINTLMDPALYEADLGGGQGAGVHPVIAANTIQGLLMHYLEPTTDEAKQARIMEAAVSFFDNYIFPNADEVAPGVISWPYEFQWNMNWGVRLDGPWYSAYANARMAESAAIMYRLTGEERYAQMARDAMVLVHTPLEEGGAEYSISGFDMPVEYIYPTDGVPNTRVLDGELIAVVATYNTARLLGDSAMMRDFFNQAASLTMQMDMYLQEDGRLFFAMYVEQMPPQYQWVIWSNLQTLANIMKDRRYFELSAMTRPHIGDFWCDSNGC